MPDKFSDFVTSLSAPADSAEVVTPNDTADLPNTSRALLLSASGWVTVDMIGIGTNIPLPLAAGYNPIRVSRVYATGTDAVTIFALF